MEQTDSLDDNKSWKEGGVASQWPANTYSVILPCKMTGEKLITFSLFAKTFCSLTNKSSLAPKCPSCRLC